MIYLDANVFVQAILNNQDKGQKARGLLEKVCKGETEACTSFLTWDELSWAVRKNRCIEDALEAGKAFLKMPNLRFIGVDRTMLNKASELMGTYRLHPRDAIHAASAMSCGANMLSEDKDFDAVGELKRIGLDEFVRKS